MKSYKKFITDCNFFLQANETARILHKIWNHTSNVKLQDAVSDSDYRLYSNRNENKYHVTAPNVWMSFLLLFMVLLYFSDRNVFVANASKSFKVHSMRSFSSWQLFDIFGTYLFPFFLKIKVITKWFFFLMFQITASVSTYLIIMIQFSNFNDTNRAKNTTDENWVWNCNFTNSNSSLHAVATQGAALI